MSVENPTFREVEPLRQRFGDDAYSSVMLAFTEYVTREHQAGRRAKPWPVAHFAMRMKQARSNDARSERARKAREARYAAQDHPEIVDAPAHVVAEFYE